MIPVTYELPRVVGLIETQSGLVVAGHWEEREGMGSMDTAFQFARTKSSGIGWWGWLYNGVHLLTTMELNCIF